MHSSPTDPARGLLDKWRNSYAETAHESSWVTAHQWTYGPEVAIATAIDVRKKLMLEPDHRILEVGAGTGAFLDAVMHQKQCGVGFDLCDAQIMVSGKFGVDRSRIKLGVAEAARLPVASESFDRVLCYSVAHYFPDDEYLCAALREMLRVCRRGGVVLLGDVAGIMERTRKILLRARMPSQLADLMLRVALPLRQVYRSGAPRRPREGRHYRRTVLTDLLRGMDCEHEFLDQEIANRPASAGRFDIRIRKQT